MPEGISLRWLGLESYQRGLMDAAKRTDQAIQSNLKTIGGRLASRTRANIGRGGADRLGTVSGDTRSGINHKFFHATKRTRGAGHMVIVGPRNRKGNLLRIHEEGLTVLRPNPTIGGFHVARYPWRPSLLPALNSVHSAFFRLMGVSIKTNV
jgi:hypothetical protein